MERLVIDGVPGQLVQDGYRFWEDPTSAKWRWALITWPDDGHGIPGHGAALTLGAAVDATQRNRRLRESMA